MVRFIERTRPDGGSGGEIQMVAADLGPSTKSRTPSAS